MNLRQVAKRARVSVATVSRALNSKSGVNASTRAKILKVAARLNYHPNLNARSLAGGKNRTLGMIASSLENPFFFDIFRAMESRAHAHGFELLIANTDYRPEQLVRSVRVMIGRRVAGLAVIVSEMDPALIRELEKRDIPVVFYDVGSAKHRMWNIRVNYRSGIERVVNYLRSLGHTRFAYIGHHSTLSPTSERQRAFVNAVSRYPNTSWQIFTSLDGPDGGKAATRELLATSFRPTAIVCVNDFMALGVLHELRVQGLQVPQNVSVTGFDNISLSQYCCPPLTTVDIPRARIGQLAFEALVPESARGRPPGREIVVDPDLVLRESTGTIEHVTGNPERST
jgi:LacI family transcriptional regulator, galactose operon repressor